MGKCSSKLTPKKCKSVRRKAKSGLGTRTNATKHDISRTTVRKVVRKTMRVEKTQQYQRAVDQACRKLVVKTFQRRGERAAGRQSCRRGKTVSAVEVEAYMKECFRSCGLKEAPKITTRTIQNYMKLVPEKFKVRTERAPLLKNTANTRDTDRRQGFRYG
jgi:hypothetical protein